MVAVPCDYLRLEISQIQMSLLSDSPYFVEAPFQSDGWRDMLTRKTAGNKVHAGQTAHKEHPRIEDARIEDARVEDARIEDARHLIGTMRKKNINKFQVLKRSSDWTNEYKRANVSLYEVLYLKDSVLYQGHSIPVNIDAIYARAYNPTHVLCNMHEHGVKSKWQQMSVPKSTTQNAKDQVLWKLSGM